MMMQDRDFDILMTLLRAGLWEKPVYDMSFFPLSDEQWRRIYVLSCEQTVSGLIYKGMSYLSKDMMPPEKEMVKWVTRIDKIERHNKRVNQTLNILHSLFAKHSLSPILQKGHIVAQMYVNPILRESGDIDFWFQPDQWSKATELAVNIAGNVNKMADGSINYCVNGVEVEHHQKFFDLQNPIKKSYLYAIFDGDENNAMYAGELRPGINRPSLLANMVLQNTHILKHSLGMGIGLRQLCDLARTYYTLSGSYDGVQLQSVYTKLGLKKWSNMLHTYLVRHIGLERDYLPYELERETSTGQFENIVKRGGNFGLYNSSRVGMASSDNSLKRKINTFFSFLRSFHFAVNYAPIEFLCRVGDLTIGQLRR